MHLSPIPSLSQQDSPIILLNIKLSFAGFKLVLQITIGSLTIYDDTESTSYTESTEERGVNSLPQTSRKPTRQFEETKILNVLRVINARVDALVRLKADSPGANPWRGINKVLLEKKITLSLLKIRTIVIVYFISHI